jgi:hypothetical protein
MSSELAALRRERTREAVARADPAFGGGASIETRLRSGLSDRVSKLPQTHAAFLATMRVQADAEALALVNELVPDSLADAIGDLVASPAAASVWAAEATALGRFAYHGDDFFGRTSELFADPKRCGRGAVAQLAELRTMLATGKASPSPSWVAIQVAAQGIDEQQARELAEFQRTPAAATWLAVRTAAFLRSRPRCDAAVAEAREAGLTNHDANTVVLQDPVLPRAVFPTEPTAAPALIFLVDDAGGVRCGDVELPSTLQPDELLDALRALRARMLANGTLHLQRHANDPNDSVDDAVMIRAPKGIQWHHVGTLMKLFADPRVAFWKVELVTDPATEQPSARRPR